MRRIVLFFILILIVGAASYFAYIEFFRAKPRDVLVLYGNVDVRQVDLGFRVPGLVTQLFYEEGDLVSAGKRLALLDDQPYVDQINQAAANVDSVKASLENAERVLNRRYELIVDGSISQEDLDTASANKEMQAANLKSAQAALAIARCNLEFTEIFAPTEGTILTRIREPGSVLNPGEPVYTLSVLSPVWIRAFVSEPDLGLIYPGMKAEILTDTEGGVAHTGKIGFISPVAEFTPKTVETTQLRTDLVYRLRIYVDNPDKQLKQGMPVTVKLLLNKEQQ